MSTGTALRTRAVDYIDPGSCTLAFGPNGDNRCWWDGRPVPAHRTRWCSTGCEHAFDEAHLWPAARAAARRRSAGRCTVCGSRAQFQVHHRIPVEDYGPGCQHHPENLEPLCSAHHRERHRRATAAKPVQLTLTAA
jgi:5-methylcytosine-specific restriction endonuclease McrA